MRASEFILGVVADARKLDRETYSPHSNTWHDPIPRDLAGPVGSTCSICFAGVWLTRHLTPSERFNSEFSGRIDSRKVATCLFLNQIRMGCFDGIHSFAKGAGIERPDELESFLDLLGQSMPTIWTQGGKRVGAFHSWDSFDKFLDEMEHLGGVLAHSGF